MAMRNVSENNICPFGAEAFNCQYKNFYLSASTKLDPKWPQLKWQHYKIILPPSDEDEQMPFANQLWISSLSEKYKFVASYH